MGNPVDEAMETIAVDVSDTSGAKQAEVDVPSNFSVAELTKAMVAELELPVNDGAGDPINYRAHLDREGRQLLPSEQCGDVLSRETRDRISLDPDHIDAG